MVDWTFVFLFARFLYNKDALCVYICEKNNFITLRFEQRRVCDMCVVDSEANDARHPVTMASDVASYEP